MRVNKYKIVNISFKLVVMSNQMVYNYYNYKLFDIEKYRSQITN